MSLHRASAALALALAVANLTDAAVSYTGGVYLQDFDTLLTASGATSNAAAFTNDVTLPGWYVASLNSSYTGAASTFTLSGTVSDRADMYSINNGASNTGELYSYGAYNSTDRALGSLGASSTDFFYGVAVQNDTGLPLKSVTVTYDGEQWRRGGTNTPQRPESIHVFYRVGGAALDNSGTWVHVPELTFTSPNVSATGAATLDGNAEENRVAGITKTFSVAVPAGEVIWIVFADADDGGTDHGMAIDNFSFSAQVDSGAAVTVGPGDAFTATSFGGAAFTADDTAVFSGEGRTITLSEADGAVSASGLRFESSGFTLAGPASAPLELTGTVHVADGVSATIAGVIAGEKGFEQTGPGTLTLTGANTFTGALSVEGRVIVGSDAALGDEANGVTLMGSGATLVVPSGFAFGAGRGVSGSGTLEGVGTLTFGGPVSLGAATLSGADEFVFAGATNSVGTITLPEPATLAVTGGALNFVAGSSGLTLGQTSGTTRVVGPVSFAANDKYFVVPGGTLAFEGPFAFGGGRVQKTGAGTLDLTAAVATGTGGIRMGVVGTGEGGLLIVSSGEQFGTSVQAHFNSGTIEASADLVASVGVSIGGRAEPVSRNASVSIPTFSGAAMTFNGASSFYYGAAPDGESDLAFDVDNVTTLAGNLSGTSTTGVNWVAPGGEGTLVIAGDASSVQDRFYLEETLTLKVDGTLGFTEMIVGPGATLSGSGTLLAKAPASVADGMIRNDAVAVQGKLDPSGLLTFQSHLLLRGSTRLDIGGLARGEDYDSVAVVVPADESKSFELQYDGSLELYFVSPAASGTYVLFETGDGVTRSGGFSSVSLGGIHAGSLAWNGSVWSGESSGVSFSFDPASGELTITGGSVALSALEEWRLTHFGTSEGAGSYADDADFDGDGIPNLIEYATGTDPKVANASALEVARSGDYLTLSFPVVDDASILYTIEGVNDLAAGFEPATGTTNDESGVRTYTDDVSITAAGGRRFLRLVVTYQE